MTVRVLVIGIGSGQPAHLTGQAVEAMNAVEVFLVADKGPAKHDLTAVRSALCAAVITHDRYRVIEVPDPPRGPDRDRDAAAYEQGVHDWHAARAKRYADVINREVGRDGVVGFLVWGDPALYDSTIRIVEQVADAGVTLTVDVVPGISSVQLLAAAFGVTLNRIGQPVHITTGRRLLREYRPELGDVVVMLDGDLACAGLVEHHPDLQIFWAAQLGLPTETLRSGLLREVIGKIQGIRAELRAQQGWVMDTYLLRPG